jgi:hypothetical protein
MTSQQQACSVPPIGYIWCLRQAVHLQGIVAHDYACLPEAPIVMALSPSELRRLANLLGMLGSNFDGERANAARLADTFVREHGITWADVLHAAPPVPVVVTRPQGPPRYWRDAALQVRADHSGAISERSYEFLHSILDRGRALTPAQEKWLRDLCDHTGVPQW